MYYQFTTTVSLIAFFQFLPATTAKPLQPSGRYQLQIYLHKLLETYVIQNFLLSYIISQEVYTSYSQIKEK